MKYLEYRSAYRAIEKIDNVQLRVRILKLTTVSFREFYESLTDHKQEKLIKRMQLMIKRAA